MLSAYSDQRNLLQSGKMIFPVGFSFGGRDLLNDGARRWRRTKIFSVDLVERGEIIQIIQVHIRHHNLVEFHVCLFEIVEKVSHALSQLVLRRGGIDTAMRSRNKSIFRGAIKSIAGKNARA